MIKILASLCLTVAVAASTACASHDAAGAPTRSLQIVGARGGTVCDASGDVLFEIDTDLTGDRSNKVSADIAYANGAWRSTNLAGKDARGCLSGAELSTIQHDVATATWQTSPRQGIRCHMERRDPIVYSAYGKEVYVDGGCSSPELDDVSAKALGEISQVIANATSRPMTEPR